MFRNPELFEDYAAPREGAAGSSAADDARTDKYLAFVWITTHVLAPLAASIESSYDVFAIDGPGAGTAGAGSSSSPDGAGGHDPPEPVFPYGPPPTPGPPAEALFAEGAERGDVGPGVEPRGSPFLARYLVLPASAIRFALAPLNAAREGAALHKKKIKSSEDLASLAGQKLLGGAKSARSVRLRTTL